ncbi:MAG: questin oxidase family protein [Candidatus Binatia bacterium]
MSDAYAVIDEALEMLSGYGPDLGNGFTNHAPMVVEALCALGRPSSVLPWLEGYRARMLPRPARHQQIRADQWRAALADEQRFADWSAFFSEELRDNPWRAVVRRWTARLAPGVSAAATHGVIRVGHAVRALAAGTSPMRLASLADGLAYWAATYQELPVREVAGAPTWRPRDAITRVALVPPERRRFAGTIGSSLEALADWPDCATAIGLLDVSGDLAALTSELAEVFARVYLANARDALSAIVFIHAVTSTAAVSHIRPYLDVAGARALVRFVWQAGCGLFAAFGSAGPAAAHPGSTRAHGTALIDLAIEQEMSTASNSPRRVCTRMRWRRRPCTPLPRGTRSACCGARERYDGRGANAESSRRQLHSAATRLNVSAVSGAFYMARAATCAFFSVSDCRLKNEPIRSRNLANADSVS